MPLPHFIVPYLSDTETESLASQLEMVIAGLQNKFINLNPAQRQRYGSINERNRLLMEMVQDYRNNQPTLSNPEVDWDEFALCWNSRENSLRLARLCKELLELLNDPRILTEHNLLQAAMQDFSFTEYRANKGSTGGAFESKYDKMRSLFKKKKKRRKGHNPLKDKEDPNPQ